MSTSQTDLGSFGTEASTTFVGCSVPRRDDPSFETESTIDLKEVDLLSFPDSELAWGSFASGKAFDSDGVRRRKGV